MYYINIRALHVDIDLLHRYTCTTCRYTCNSTCTTCISSCLINFCLSTISVYYIYYIKVVELLVENICHC